MMKDSRACLICGETKPLSDFPVRVSRGKSGFRGYCYARIREYPRKYRRIHLPKPRTRVESPEYLAWKGMKKRCFNPKQPKYPRYGGRGITVCQEWLHNFKAFLSHIGPRPGPEYSLDRIKNDGNYEPGNVRWATAKQQQANGSRARLTTFMGEPLPLNEVGRRIGISGYLLGRRLNRGWTLEQAISIPAVGCWHEKRAIHNSNLAKV